METLKVVWDEDPERCYSLYCIAGKTVRVRTVFGGRLIAEVFSTAALRWELLTMPTARMEEHTKEHVNQMTVEALEQAQLILGAGRRLKGE